MDNSATHPRITRSFLPVGLLLAAVFCVAVYVPGLGGDFVFDDVPNITANPNLLVDTASYEGIRQAVFSVDAGSLKRPVSMLTFWLNYYTTGLDPFYFKLTNLLIHLLNGLGLFCLTKLLLETARIRETATLSATHRNWVALAIAGVWLVHPLNLTGVLYVVQRMTSLSATFVILGLICYVVGRRRLAAGASGFPLILFGLVGCGLLAVLSKESGALLPLFIAAIEVTLFQFKGLGKATRPLKVFFLITVILPAAAAAVYLLLNPNWILGGYPNRGFTLTERLMTEARALWLYLGWTIAPTRSGLGLFHDDVPLSQGLLDPPSTLFAVVGLATLGAAAIGLRTRAPLFAFAVLWFFAGHVMESSAIPLDLIYEHRNYLPIFGPLFAVVFYLSQIAGRLGSKAAVAVPAALSVLLGSVTFARAQDWSDLYTLRMAVVRDHPESAIANYEAGIAVGNVLISHPEFVATDYERAKTHLERSAALDNESVNAQFALILLSASTDHPIDERLLDDLSGRLSKVTFNFKFVEGLRQLVGWTAAGIAIPNQTVMRVFEAALSNETLPAGGRAVMLSLLSGYRYSVGDVQEAVGLALAAVEADPSQPALQLALADLAIQLGNVEVATAALRAAEREDRLGRWALKRQELSELLPSTRMSEAPASAASR